jgi:hypothetical protein
MKIDYPFEVSRRHFKLSKLATTPSLAVTLLGLLPNAVPFSSRTLALSETYTPGSQFA